MQFVIYYSHNQDTQKTWILACPLDKQLSNFACPELVFYFTGRPHAFALAHQASENEKFYVLARQENLLVPEKWSVFFHVLSHSSLKSVTKGKSYTNCEKILTVRKTASTASLKAATTFVFFSLNFSKSGVIIMEEYCVNFLRRPVANWPIHLAARATTITFASLAMIWIKMTQRNEKNSLLNKTFQYNSLIAR